MYTIELSPKLRTAKIPANDYSKIREKIVLLINEPRPRWAEKIKTTEYLRIAVGDYRVLYEVDDKRSKIIIHAIGHRKDVYRR